MLVKVLTIRLLSVYYPFILACLMGRVSVRFPVYIRSHFVELIVYVVWELYFYQGMVRACGSRDSVFFL